MPQLTSMFQFTQWDFTHCSPSIWNTLQYLRKLWFKLMSSICGPHQLEEKALKFGDNVRYITRPYTQVH
jgi:hypothetical protein